MLVPAPLNARAPSVLVHSASKSAAKCLSPVHSVRAIVVECSKNARSRGELTACGK